MLVGAATEQLWPLCGDFGRYAACRWQVRRYAARHPCKPTLTLVCAHFLCEGALDMGNLPVACSHPPRGIEEVTRDKCFALPMATVVALRQRSAKVRS